MTKAQLRRVQGQALVLPVRMCRQIRAVARIAENRMPTFREVNANLIPPARLQPDTHHGCAVYHALQLKMRDCQLGSAAVLRRILLKARRSREVALERAALGNLAI